MEIIIDKRGKSLLKYSEEDIVQTKELLSEIPDIGKIRRSTSSIENTTSDYLNFKLHGRPYKIRMSDHIPKSYFNEVITGIKDTNRGIWIIDTGIGRYKPEDVVKIVKNLDAGLQHYKSNDEKKKLRNFINEKLKEYEENDDNLCSDDEVLQFAKDYMNEHQVKDDKYGTQSYVLKFLFHIILGWRE